MILLDTTVLVYAKGQDHPLRDPCRTLIEAVAEHQIEATTTVEVIQEFVHVRARRRGRTDAASLGRDYAALLSPLLSPTGQNLHDGLALFERTPGMGAFDAVLVASASETGITHLISADRDFADLPELSHVFPDQPGVAALLAGI
jgi:predicted nucleic acid-binding protein